MRILRQINRQHFLPLTKKATCLVSFGVLRCIVLTLLTNHKVTLTAIPHTAKTGHPSGAPSIFLRILILIEVSPITSQNDTNHQIKQMLRA